MKKLLGLVGLCVWLSACASYSKLYVPDANYLERRNIETRIFDTQNTKELLVASAQLLQDMGYTITESDSDIGVITATKMREAGSTVGKVALEILSILDKHSTQEPVYEDKQKFFVTVVNSQTKDRKVRTRVTFARITYDNFGSVMRIEKLKDTKLYAEFFDKLSQSVFLTANNI